jgi:hypothetical protein
MAYPPFQSELYLAIAAVLDDAVLVERQGEVRVDPYEFGRLRDEAPKFTTWCREWPIEPGWYFLYGFRSKLDRELAGAHGRPPRLWLIRVGRDSSDNPMWMSDGSFFSPREGGGGLWAWAAIPPVTEAP